jgi:NitT/TauT family transport system permease protein
MSTASNSEKRGARDGPPAQSADYALYLRRMKRRTLLVHFWQAAILLVFLAVWEIAPLAGWVNPALTSYPTAIGRTLTAFVIDGSLWHHSWTTLEEILFGFVGSMALGTVIAVAFWLSPMLYRTLDPFVVVINAIPKVAFVPIFFIWLGSLSSIYAMSIAVSVFVTVLMLHTGFRAIDPDKVKLVQLFGASRRQILSKIILPGSVPTMMSTLKVNVGLTLVGVVVGEFQAAKAGLGYLIIYGSQIFQINIVMAAVAVLAGISTLLFIAIQALEAHILNRRGSSGT